MLVATPSSTDGTATALVLSKTFRTAFPVGEGPSLTLLAKGVMAGSDISFADPITLGHAVGERSTIEGAW